MIRRFFALCLLFFPLLLRAQKEDHLRVRIDLQQETTGISPLLFGQFIEHLGRCISGGLYEEGSPLSDEHGFRTDVLEKVKGLSPPLLRYPGGTVIKIYQWEDGIGPKTERRKRPNLIWGGVEDNHFGTAEFVQYCRLIGAEPFLVVNMSTGTPMDAANWVEYCNGTSDTYYANLRRSHGFPEPFRVKYWGIGNEEYAEPDAGRHQRVENYIEDGWQFVKLMKLQDPSIRITLVGTPDDLAWSRAVLREMHPVCDFLSVHLYAMPRDGSQESLLQAVRDFSRNLDSLRVLLGEVPDRVEYFPMWYRFPPRSEKVRLAIDEWGIWDINSGKGTGAYRLEYPYNWLQALATGQFLHLFFRNSDIIGLATWAQLVNVLAPITTTPDSSFCQTVYTALQAYRHRMEARHLPVAGIPPEQEAGRYLSDVAASISDDGQRIVLAVLNHDPEKNLPLAWSVEGNSDARRFGAAQWTSYTAGSYTEPNSVTRNLVSENTRQFMNGTGLNEIVLSPASLNFILLLPDTADR
jgi:alpha-L-arabinofuranosidase